MWLFVQLCQSTPSTTINSRRPASSRSAVASTMPKPSQSDARPSCDGNATNAWPAWPYTSSSMSWPRLPLNQSLDSRLISVRERSRLAMDLVGGSNEHVEIRVAHQVAVIADGGGKDAVHARFGDDEWCELVEHLVVCECVLATIAPADV